MSDPKIEKRYSLLPVSPETALKFIRDPIWHVPRKEVEDKLTVRLRNCSESLFRNRDAFRFILGIRGPRDGADFNVGYCIGFRILQLQEELPGAILKKPKPELSNHYLDYLKDSGTNADDYLREHEDHIQEKDPVFYRLLEEYAEHRSGSASFSEHKEIKLGGFALYGLVANDISQNEIQELDALFSIEP